VKGMTGASKSGQSKPVKKGSEATVEELIVSSDVLAANGDDIMESQTLSILGDVYAYVEVFIDEGETDASKIFKEHLKTLGARVGFDFPSGFLIVQDCPKMDSSSFSCHLERSLWLLCPLILSDGRSIDVLKKTYNDGDPISFIVTPLWVEA